MALRAVIVGAGGMGRAWGKNVHGCPGVEIAGWVDINPDSARRAADVLELSNVYTGDDLGKALSVTKPDFVIDVTIPGAHKEVTLTALSAGYPVLGEKPMTTGMAEAKEMVAASERTGKLYMVSQSRRYDTGIQAFRELVAGRLGSLGIMNSEFYIGAHFGGFRDTMDSPLILDMAIHTFDAARYISGLDPVSVYCEEFNPSWSWYTGNASATAIFEMAGGLRYTYTGSWCAEGKATAWECDWRVVGENGSAVWDGAGSPSADIVTGTDGFRRQTDSLTQPLVDSDQTGIRGSLIEFLNALTTGSTPMGECHDNIKSLAMVFGSIESAVTGKRVLVSA